ncbi:hypothetical protein DEU56DRAFT_755529 [Suillus clintonianus]|uniref:uncharacterized protein n=1 Tax=Suillus clintonianus TaxID=1904413 RepID=UPI001B86BF43|nr:uncharacterized protein DEU56DRAFT_755529 [Suillus clintonianus]KAG2139781.1 hypothetical protein DEU56DRAFT_755529 [Suillus clintonianus]
MGPHYYVTLARYHVPQSGIIFHGQNTIFLLFTPLARPPGNIDEGGRTASNAFGHVRSILFRCIQEEEEEEERRTSRQEGSMVYDMVRGSRADPAEGYVQWRLGCGVILPRGRDRVKYLVRVGFLQSSAFTTTSDFSSAPFLQGAGITVSPDARTLQDTGITVSPDPRNLEDTGTTVSPTAQDTSTTVSPSPSDHTNNYVGTLTVPNLPSIVAAYTKTIEDSITPHSAETKHMPRTLVLQSDEDSKSNNDMEEKKAKTPGIIDNTVNMKFFNVFQY